MKAVRGKWEGGGQEKAGEREEKRRERGREGGEREVKVKKADARKLKEA